MEPKQHIIEALKHIVQAFVPDHTDIQLSEPSNLSYGDYTTNVAMMVAKKVGKQPMELAEEIAMKLLQNQALAPVLQEVQAITPGFVNITLKNEVIINNLSRLLSMGKKVALTGKKEKKKIMVEFTDPNPFKEFHIGHLFSNVVGESLARLLESQGEEVTRECYKGDIGLHVAKSVWGMTRKLDKEKLTSASLEEKPLTERMKFLGESYALGAKMYAEDEKVKEEINLLNKRIYDQDPLVNDLYEKGRSWSLAYFETIYQRLGTKFEAYYFESVVGKTGLQYVKENMKTGVFEEDNGAVVFRGEQYGLHTRVFINSLGLPTYEAKDLGLAPAKYQDYAYDQSIIVTGNEVDSYFRVILKALSLINPDLAAKTKHISHGMLRLPTGKMSSRTGNVITGAWLLDEAKKQIRESYQEMDDETSEKVAIAAIKYAMLKSGVGKNIEFSFHESISLEGDSGPYLQYTFARTKSLLRKAQDHGKNAEGTGESKSYTPDYTSSYQGYQMNSEEQVVLRMLYRFPEVVKQAKHQYSPNILCTYLFELAQLFNHFYQKHTVLGEEKERAFRLFLTAGVGKTIQDGLHLLGIEAPGKM